jgi:hypothetical protein
MQELGKVLIGLGLVLTLVGFLLWKTGGLGPLGRLPGDITIKGENSTIYFPIVTCVVISLVVTLISWLVRHYSSK